MKMITIGFDDKDFKRMKKIKDKTRYTWKEILAFGIVYLEIDSPKLEILKGENTNENRNGNTE